MRVQTFVVGFIALVLSCATLDPLASNTCGNGVIDANEDCDSFPAGQCGEPSAGEAKCRLKCGKQPNGGEPLACPDGWGCSVSGFCRQPTGTFSPSSEPVSAGVTTMLVGDFDGDGRADVLGSSGPTSKGRIHYFKEGAAPQVVALPGVLASPVVFDVDADGRSDIAFGYTFRGARVGSVDGTAEVSFAGGYAIMLGQTDRAVVTKLFPTLTAPGFDAIIVPAAANKDADLPAAAGDGLVAVATFRAKDGSAVTLLRSLDGDPTDLTQGFAKVLPGGIADLAGEPMSGRIFDGISRSTCGQIVVPFKLAGGARIQIYSPCTRVGLKVEWSKEEPKELSFAGETLKRIFVTDVDGDRHPDIVIGTTLADGKSKIRVAYGNAAGTDLEVEDAPSDLTDVPLAAGFLDADLRLDFVVPSGVLLSKGGGGGVVDAGDGDGGVLPATPRAKLQWVNIPAPTKSWTVAQIADVNRDGVPDVIAGSQYEPDIDVLEGTRSVNMPPFTISTTGSVTNLVVGDFDFDGNGDIAFVQARPASTDREVAISYGRALTMPPESPRLAGRLDGIRQLFVTASGITITSAAAAKPGDLPSFSLAVLLASGERQPVAPLLFADGDPGGVGTAEGTTRRELSTRALVASPAATPGAIDLIGLVQQTEYARANGKRESDPTYAVWVAPGTGLTSFIAPSKQFDLPNLPAVDRSSDSFLVQMVSGDLDGDKKAEIVAVSPDQTGNGAQLFVIRPGPQSALPQSVPIPDRTAPGGVRSQLLDVDGDGHVDLVTILTNGQKKKAEVNVFFGDGKAGFAIPGMVVKLTVPEGGSFDDFTALGFTQITTGGGAIGAAGGKRRELAIVTPKHLFRAFVRADRSVDLSEATSAFGVITYGSAVVAGDIDGDGVDDLAIADQGSIRIARQIARLP